MEKTETPTPRSITPRTDAVLGGPIQGSKWRLIRLCEELEAELVAARACIRDALSDEDGCVTSYEEWIKKHSSAIDAALNESRQEG